MRIPILLLAVALPVLGGCVRSVVTYTCEPNKPNTGVMYSLPKTLLKVSITYTIEKETRLQAGLVRSSTESAVIRRPIMVEPVVTCDPCNCFVLSGAGLTKDAALDSSFKFQVSDNLLLTGVTAEATDKTPEILQGVVSSGLSLLKMAAMAGEEATTPMKEVAARLAAIDQQIAALAAEADPNGGAPPKMAKLDALQKEQQVWLSFVAKHRESNATKTETREVVFTRTLDLTGFKWGNDRWTITDVKAPAALLGLVANSAVPGVTVEVFANAAQHSNSTRVLPTSTTGVKGIIYRDPLPLRTRITVAPWNLVFFDDYIPFAQVGPFNTVEARYKALAKRKTTMTFSAATGGLKEYGVDATSSAEAAAKAVDVSLGKVQTALGEIQKLQDAAEAARKTPEQMKLSDLEIQKRLADAETALIEAQQRLEKAKSAAGSK